MNVSTLQDETAADVPVRDTTVNQSRPAADPSLGSRQDVSRVSREELEDRYLRLHEESLLLKQHINRQDDKIRKLGTKLMRLVKDRSRMEQLAVGGGPMVSRVRDVEMEEVMEELQEKVRGLQAEKEVLKQRLLVAKQQLLNSQSRRPSPYGRVQSRVNSGLRTLRDDASSPSPTRPKSTRSSEGGGRPPTGLLPRFGHSLLEEARAEVRNLEDVIEVQRTHMEELEGASELLREELRRKEAEFEERLLQVRQQQTSRLRSQVSSSVTMIRLQQQLAERSNGVSELEGRFLQLQESQRTLKVSHDAAMLKVDELSAQLKEERTKTLDLERQLQSSTLSRMKMEQLQERIREAEQERDQLKDNNEKLVNSAFDVSRQQQWQIQEQQLKVQIAQLETALKADLVDKNEILDKIQAERDASEKLTEDNQKLQLQFVEQQQQLEELRDRLKFYSRENEDDVAELSEALLLIKKRKSQRSADLGFLKEVEEGGGTETSLQDLRAAHTETIQELDKTRTILSMETRISNDYKVELEAVMKKMDVNKTEFDQKLERQAALLDTRAAKIKRLEAQLRDVSYGTKSPVFKPDVTDEDEADEFEESLQLQRGENVVELQLVGATLSPAALQALGDGEPSTFCTYAFDRFKLHSSPVATGPRPRYGFTSKYVVSVDQRFLDHLHRGSVRVELHQALGLDWRTLAAAQLPLQQLLDQDGRVDGNAPLVGVCDESRSFGSVDYWLRLRTPMTETLRLFKEQLKTGGHFNSSLDPDTQLQPPGGCNQIHITVQRCRDLKKSRSSQLPSPYVVCKFFDFPDYPTATVHDSCDPVFNDLKTYQVPMDTDLDQYLKSGVLQLYVFNYKEEQMDTYMGKARVPLLPLAQDQDQDQDQGITGVFELTDPSGLHAGHIEVTLRWTSSSVPPSVSVVTSEEPEVVPKEEDGVEDQETDRDVDEMLQEEDKLLLHHPPISVPQVSGSKAPLPRLRLRTPLKDGPTAKKVSFIDPSAPEDQVEDRTSPGVSGPADRRQTVPPVVKVSSSPAAHIGAAEDEDEDEESHFSEGQLVPVSRSYSDDSDLSEEILEDVEETPAGDHRRGSPQSDRDHRRGSPQSGRDHRRGSPQSDRDHRRGSPQSDRDHRRGSPQSDRDHRRGSPQSDSDDCIVHGQTAGRKVWDRVRVEVVSLSLSPESRVSLDSSVVRLFVEYSLLDLPTEETPLSLPKPPRGQTINYNYSKVIPVDSETNGPRRRLLRGVLQGRNPQMERIRFTVVSEPPEEEEQERECEDVGVAFIRIPDILDRQRDLTETSLDVVDVDDSSQVVGSLTVSVEGLEALQAIMEDRDLDQDQDQERTQVSSLLPSA